MFTRLHPLGKNLKPLMTFKRDFKDFKKKRKVPRGWQRQSELLSDMGMNADTDPAHPDTVAQTEMFDDLRDEVQDMYIRDNPGINRMIGSEKKRSNKRILRKIIGEKYFKTPQEENLLTYDAKQQIKYLNAEYPDEWTPEKIAESFPISVEGAKRFLAKNIQFRFIEDVIRHDTKVQERWRALTSAGEAGPLKNRYKELMEAGQVGLLKNAAGYISVPMPEKVPLPSRHSRHLNRDPNKPPGPWASIVHDYCEMQDNLTGKTQNLISKGKYLHVPQRPESNQTKEQHVKEQAKLLQDVTRSIEKREPAKKVKERLAMPIDYNGNRREPSKETQLKSLSGNKPLKKSEMLENSGVSKEDDKKETNFQGWFRFDEVETVSQESELSRRVEPSTMLQSAVDKDLTQPQEVRKDSLRRSSSLRRRRIPLSPELAERRSLEKMLYSNEDIEDMSVLFRKEPKRKSELETKASELESDPGLAGTQKIKSRGVSYTELLKQEKVKPEQSRTSKPSFSDRQGAYGYFSHDTVSDTTNKRNVQEPTKISDFRGQTTGKKV